MRTTGILAGVGLLGDLLGRHCAGRGPHRIVGAPGVVPLGVGRHSGRFVLRGVGRGRTGAGIDLFGGGAGSEGAIGVVGVAPRRLHRRHQFGRFVGDRVGVGGTLAVGLEVRLRVGVGLEVRFGVGAGFRLGFRLGVGVGRDRLDDGGRFGLLVQGGTASGAEPILRLHRLPAQVTQHVAA